MKSLNTIESSLSQRNTSKIEKAVKMENKRKLQKHFETAESEEEDTFQHLLSHKRMKLGTDGSDTSGVSVVEKHGGTFPREKLEEASDSEGIVEGEGSCIANSEEEGTDVEFLEEIDSKTEVIDLDEEDNYVKVLEVGIEQESDEDIGNIHNSVVLENRKSKNESSKRKDFELELEEQLLRYATEDDTSTSSSSDSDLDLLNSSTSDEEIQEAENNNQPLFTIYKQLMSARRQNVDNNIAIVHQYSSSEFKKHFHMERQVVYDLLRDLEESGFIPTHTFGMNKITAECSLLMTIWFLANNEPLRCLSERFNIAISSAFLVIRRVVTWLDTMVDEKIRWPRGDKVSRVASAFEVKGGIPGCIGAIDSTHVKIRQPKHNHEAFRNRNKYYSLVVQAVVDSDLKFSSIYCGEPGSMHDGQVLRRSDLFAAAQENTEQLFPNRTFLIGDFAYPSLPWLIPPFKNIPQLTEHQKDFNSRHFSTRVAIKKALGLMKGRFQRLETISILDIGFVPKIILACCVLHNICVDRKDNLDYEFYAQSDDEIEIGLDGREDRRMEIFSQLYR